MVTAPHRIAKILYHALHNEPHGPNQSRSRNPVNTLMNEAMRNAFRDLANGNFVAGLTRLGQLGQWHDDTDSLDGPFFLGFPCAAGWGEGLFLASLLKRYAVVHNKQVKVFAHHKTCSILIRDETFCAKPVTDCSDAYSKGARPPLAILKSALTGGLLDLPFAEIAANATHPKSSRAKPQIGIAWASIDKRDHPIGDKSIPLSDFLPLLGEVDADVISFQRKLRPHDRDKLQDAFKTRCTIFDDNELDASDQTCVVDAISGIDCMMTISTTTAHIAACLGIPVVLLAARRKGQQWFWRAQEEHKKYFYPNVNVILGSVTGDTGDWWQSCLEPAKCAFIAAIGRCSKKPTT